MSPSETGAPWLSVIAIASCCESVSSRCNRVLDVCSCVEDGCGATRSTGVMLASARTMSLGALMVSLSMMVGAAANYAGNGDAPRRPLPILDESSEKPLVQPPLEREPVDDLVAMDRAYGAPLVAIASIAAAMVGSYALPYFTRSTTPLLPGNPYPELFLLSAPAGACLGVVLTSACAYLLTGRDPRWALLGAAPGVALALLAHAFLIASAYLYRALIVEADPVGARSLEPLPTYGYGFCCLLGGCLVVFLCSGPTVGCGAGFGAALTPPAEDGPPWRSWWHGPSSERHSAMPF